MALYHLSLLVFCVRGVYSTSRCFVMCAAVWNNGDMEVQNGVNDLQDGDTFS